MGVKVEGVRSDERVAVADTTARNRKMLIGAVVMVVVVLVVVFGLMTALKPTPTYGPSGHLFEAGFGGTPSMSSQPISASQYTPTGGLASVQTYRFANSTATQEVEVSATTEVILGGDARPLLQQELGGGYMTTLAGFPAIELVTHRSGALSLPYTETAVMIDGTTQYVIQASGDSGSVVAQFVNSFKLAS